jgi:uncharacterized protein
LSGPIRDIEPWFADGLEVRESAIHGLGLFAGTYFPRGADLIRLGGRLFHISERRLPEVMPSTTTPISEEVVLAEPSYGKKDLSDYVNHSCNPNIGFRDAMCLVAINDVSANEELVTDYAFWEADSGWRLKAPCNCGSLCCRRTVSGGDWKSVRPDDEPFQYFSPFLKRRILSLTRGEDAIDTR